MQISTKIVLKELNRVKHTKYEASAILRRFHILSHAFEEVYYLTLYSLGYF